MPVTFRDRALQLLLLDAAWKEGLLPRWDKVAFYRDQLGIAWSFDADYSRGPDPRVLEALLAIPLEPALLARISEFRWDAANDVCFAIWSQWDGEDDMFDVHVLDGLEHCTGLRNFIVNGGSFRSIAPMRALVSLETVSIWTLDDPLADLTPLRDLPALKNVALYGNYVSTPANEAVLATLQQRGVTTRAFEDAWAQVKVKERGRQLLGAKDVAATAFKEGRWQDVIKALSPHEAELPESDRKKLAYARRKLASP